MKVLGALIVLAGLVLSYGYWHQQTHATLHLSIDDISTPGQYGSVKGASVLLMDEAGRVLAEGATDNAYGTFYVKHPQAGYCGPDLNREAYQRCFTVHTAWLTTWVEDVRYASVAAGGCRIERAPLTLNRYFDSILTWWIPLPHVGGNPYTSYSATLLLDVGRCAVRSSRQ
jgi:hypothetical protein